MNQLISTHYASSTAVENEYRIYECKKGKSRYLAVVHASLSHLVEDEKILLNRFPCAMPISWALPIIRRIDSALSRLQLIPNPDLPYLVFSLSHAEYISQKVKEEIIEINEAYLELIS